MGKKWENCNSIINKKYLKKKKKKYKLALAGPAEWIECLSAASSIPSQRTHLGGGPVAW